MDRPCHGMSRSNRIIKSMSPSLSWSLANTRTHNTRGCTRERKRTDGVRPKCVTAIIAKQTLNIGWVRWGGCGVVYVFGTISGVYRFSQWNIILPAVVVILTHPTPQLPLSSFISIPSQSTVVRTTFLCNSIIIKSNTMMIIMSCEIALKSRELQIGLQCCILQWNQLGKFPVTSTEMANNSHFHGSQPKDKHFV